MAVVVIRPAVITILLLSLRWTATGVGPAGVCKPRVCQGTALCYCHGGNVVCLNHVGVRDAGGQGGLAADADFLATAAGCAWSSLNVLDDLHSDGGGLPAACMEQHMHNGTAALSTHTVTVRR